MKKKLKLAGVLLGATLVTASAVASGDDPSQKKKDGMEMMDGNKTAMMKKSEEMKKHADKKVGAGK